MVEGNTAEIEERLLRVDMEIHAILHALRSTRKDRASIEALAAAMEQDRIVDDDTTDILRAMRDREAGP